MRSLRAKLVTGTTTGMAVVLLAAGAVVYLLVRASLVDQLDASLTDKAALLASAVEQEKRKIETDFDELDLSAYHGPEGPGYLQLRCEDGSIVYRSPSLQGRSLEPAPAAGEGLSCRWLPLSGGRTGRAVTLSFHPRRNGSAGDELPGGEKPASGPVTLVLAWDASPTQAALASLRAVLLVVGLLAMGGSSGLLWLVIRRSLSPVKQIAERIGRLDERSLADRVVLGAAPSELRPLVDRLNDLLRRLDAAFERERGFSADAAHELRTPLAGLRTTLEVAASRPREPAEYREMIGDCRAIVTRMQGMVENLLTLARLESGQVETSPEEVVVEDVARAEWRSLERRARQRRLGVRWESGTRRCVLTDRSLASLIVRNLLDNAVTHAREAGTLEVEVRDDRSGVRFRVANPGGPVSPEQADMVFERFWRGDAARSGSGHSGLGLSLTKRAAELLGAPIHVSTAEDGRFEVVVTFPPLAAR